MQTKRPRHRSRSVTGPLVFFFLLAALMLWPLLASRRMVGSAGGDLSAHLSGIVEAGNALAEGQFPLRIAPAANDGTRYPLFAYYGNFPYTIGGLLYHVLGIDPYTTWKIINLVALAGGGFFTFRCCEVLTRLTLPSVAAGAAFVLAPYMWTDIHVRSAFPETIAFNLLPILLFYGLRSFTTRRAVPVYLSGIGWSLLALTHNISYLYGSLFMGLFFGLLAFMSIIKRPRSWSVVLRRLLRVAGGYGIGVLLTLWYLVPQFYTLDYIDTVSRAATPVGGDILTTLSVLSSPVLASAPGANTSNIGLQIGWPVLAGVLLSVNAMLRRRCPARLRWVIAGLLVLFALSLLLVAMPSAWWGPVPTLFYHIQSSYRALMFIVLWGSLLMGLALAVLTHAALRPWHLALVLGLVALSCLSYLPRHAAADRGALLRLIANPDLGGSGGKTNYLPSSKAAARTTWFHPDLNFAPQENPFFEYNGWLSQSGFDGGAQIFVPRSAVARPGAKLLIEGAVPREYGTTPAILNIALGNASFLPIELKTAEGFRVDPYVPEGAAIGAGDEPLLLTLRADRYPLRGGSLAFPIYRVSIVPPKPAARKLLRAHEVKTDPSFHNGRRFTVQIDQPTLLQLPVLYYPSVLRVRMGGKDMTYGNVGPYVALPLEPGKHRITVEYVGIRWATVASGIVWMFVLGGLGFISNNKLKRAATVRERSAAGARNRSLTVAARSGAIRRSAPPAFSLPSALVCFAAMGGIVLAPAAWRQVRKTALPRGPDVNVTASHSSDDAHPPANAFDADDATEWSAWGGEPAVTLTVVPDRPAALRKVTLESRQTGLYESWQAVRIEQFRGGQRVATRDIPLPEAATKSVAEIVLEPVVADRIELRFSSPVCVTRDGGTRVEPAATNPGYREIRLSWDPP